MHFRQTVIIIRTKKRELAQFIYTHIYTIL